jgi:hypothetical protein
MESPAAVCLNGANTSSIPQGGYPIAALKRRLLFQNSVLEALSLPRQAPVTAAFPSQQPALPFPTHRSHGPSPYK